ncbi:hypothetical protein PV08_05607 [Exophiala spinifera]|uniref:Coatomer subunit epsilon n=1 Tax=Exophiala spinifera TaxID=91928 RepID=A0A0D2BWD7_9EURO|nr:uncharacterized protein PV08_05607 [Exophiala spinifera]KIW15559.1 hypothetical protein PV08_05607 [Exophiala spinifera]
MDPFSGEGELLNITTAFYTHAYQTVLDFDTSALSPANQAVAQTLKYRAQIALGDSSSVISELKPKASSSPSSRALLALAQNDVEAATELATDASTAEDPVVQVCAGTVLASAGEYATAIDLLSKHQGSLEAVGLLVQIRLSQNRTDLAVKEVQGAKRWANDSLLINLAESWTNLRAGGSEKYQSAFYVYEELASAPGNTSPTALLCQAIAELHLGRLEEAEVALQQAVSSDGADVQAIANSIVLASVMGKKDDVVKGLIEQLRERDQGHVLLKDLEEKSALFDAAAAKYSAKVTA